MRRLPRRPWTPRELAQLRRLYPSTQTKQLARLLRRRVTQVYQKAIGLGLRKSAAYLASPAASRLRRGDHVGKAFEFKPGHVPWNKGRKGWKAGGRSPETRFRKGCRPQTWVPIGTEVVDADGYRKRKVSDDRTRPSRYNWKYVHVIVWERRRGPVPKGHAIAFRNGDKSDIRLRNLECLSRQDLMRRNTVHRLPKDLVRVIQLRAAVVRQIRRKANAQNRRSA